ncbi:MAG: helix-turn-helix domain-containing protein, partial [Raoultibacter sp.]
VFRIPCNLTIDECAGLLEIHYATCSKLCRALKERGILDKTRKYLEIRDRAQLQHLLQEENPILY